MRAATMPGVPKLMLDRRMAPVIAAVLEAADAPRQHPGDGPGGPQPGDRRRLGAVRPRAPAAGRWTATARAMARLRRSARGSLNTGSWLYEPLLVHRAAPPHPYWPGGAVLLERRPGPAGAIC